MNFQIRRIVDTTNGYEQTETPSLWNPGDTAVIICDMWDRHWCKGASRRVAEVAPRMNSVLKRLRSQGVLIAHAPSDVVDYYENHPARQLTLELSKGITLEKNPAHEEIVKKEPTIPVDIYRRECDCGPVKCPQGNPWRKQIETLDILDNDLIGDGLELLHAFKARGITNVIIMGVHTNLCVVGRPFGIRSLVSHGFNTVLMRDMTDCMAPREEMPYTDHFTALDYVVWHIERYLCGTITSGQVLDDGIEFRFAEDSREIRPDFTEYLRFLENNCNREGSEQVNR